jgi:hypothetical protein
VTYGRQGTLKNGLSEADIKAHAVIYMVGTSSAAAPGEKIVKNPIAVHPAREDQKLHPMSRINFDKIYTIEHNVKVMNVGKVAHESSFNLWRYFTNHQQLAYRGPNEPSRKQLQHVVSDDEPVQRPQTINHGRRLSVNHGSGLPTISGSGLLKATRIAGDTKGHSEVMDERKSD